MKHSLNEIQRSQRLAGLNEWKITPALAALYYDRALEAVESYEDEDMLEDFKNEFPRNQLITKKKWLEWNEQYLDDMSELEYVKQHWKYITTGDESVYDLDEGLNEWKIQSKASINPEDLYLYGEYDDSTRTFEVEMGSDSFADYMNTAFPGWLEDNKISDEGLRRWINEIEKAIRIEYGKEVNIEFI